MKRRVLIIEDEQDLALLIKRHLEGSGFEVQTVSRGDDGLRAAETAAFDLILLDLMLPGMDGIEVCRRIRADLPKAPPCIAVYTANNRPEVREACLAAGADLFYSKNLTVFELPTKIAAECLPPSESPTS